MLALNFAASWNPSKLAYLFSMLYSVQTQHIENMDQVRAIGHQKCARKTGIRHPLGLVQTLFQEGALWFTTNRRVTY
jgi:hypothetical protein